MDVKIDRGQWAPVASLEEASQKVRAHIEEQNYGASHWYPRMGTSKGAAVRSGTRTVGWISYNGRIWLKGQAR